MFRCARNCGYKFPLKLNALFSHRIPLSVHKTSFWNSHYERVLLIDGLLLVYLIYIYQLGGNWGSGNYPRCSASAKVLLHWWVWSTDESMQVTIIILAGCLNTWQWRAEMANWARVPYTVSLLTVTMYIVQIKHDTFLSVLFLLRLLPVYGTWEVNSNNKRPNNCKDLMDLQSLLVMQFRRW